MAPPRYLFSLMPADTAYQERLANFWLSARLWDLESKQQVNPSRLQITRTAPQMPGHPPTIWHFTTTLN